MKKKILFALPLISLALVSCGGVKEESNFAETTGALRSALNYQDELPEGKNVKIEYKTTSSLSSKEGSTNSDINYTILIDKKMENYDINYSVKASYNGGGLAVSTEVKGSVVALKTENVTYTSTTTDGNTSKTRDTYYDIASWDAETSLTFVIDFKSFVLSRLTDEDEMKGKFTKITSGSKVSYAYEDEEGKMTIDTEVKEEKSYISGFVLSAKQTADEGSLDASLSIKYSETSDKIQAPSDAASYL